MFSSSKAPQQQRKQQKTNQQALPQTSRLRRAQQLRQQRIQAGGRGGGENGRDDDETLVVSGLCTLVCALLIVTAGAGMATLCFSIYQPDCIRDFVQVGSVSGGVDGGNDGATPAAFASTPTEKAGGIFSGRSRLLGKELLAERKKNTIIDAEVDEHGNFPPQCTDDQMRMLGRQLPAGGCERSAKRPFRRMDCSFSVATSCGGEPYWLYDFHANDHSLKDGETFNAILVGCNKAYRAMDVLRVASRDTENDKYSRQLWREEFVKTEEQVEDKPHDCTNNDVQIGDAMDTQKASVYCIEAMPKTFTNIEATKASVGLTDQELDLTQVFMALEPGEQRVLVDDPVGVAGAGATYWNKACRFLPEDDIRCSTVPADKLDNWIKTKPGLYDGEREDQPPIHYLSIRVEDNDYEVLQGAAKTLHRVQYLDFNYHWFGDWGRSSRSLKDLIERLRKKGFACYWPGEEGTMWRITDCWQDHYQYRFWANIACINVAFPEVQPLAAKMEDMFQNTLSKPYLRYGKV